MTKAHESEITLRLASLIGFTFKVSKQVAWKPTMHLSIHLNDMKAETN